jgi:hypothetical protein
MSKRTLTTTIHHRINGKMTDLVVLASYTNQKDIEIQSVTDPSGNEIKLTEEQRDSFTFICMELLPEHETAAAEYLYDTLIPR